MVKEIDRSEQQILGGVLVKNLKELIEARNNNKIWRTIQIYRETPPGPNTKKEVKIEKTRMGLRVYGKGANRNKLVVHTIHSPANRSNPPKEQLPLNEEEHFFWRVFGGIYKFGRWKKVGVLLLLLASIATAFWVLNV